jgi:arabinogalactan endo-1,4-beta-galactosidase
MMSKRIFRALVPAMAVACWTTAYNVGTESTIQHTSDAAATDGGRSDGPPIRRDAAADAGIDSSGPSFYLGADVSRVQEEEDKGKVFYDTDGTEKDIFQILKNHGFNYVRLRAFVDPLTPEAGYDTAWVRTTTGYCDTAHTATMGARVKAAGMGFLLDLHMSDNWAEPPNQLGQPAPAVQVTPVAWQGDTLSQLVTQVQTYTNSVVTQLVAANARPDMVQIGNGIEAGMLFPLGSTSNWANLAQLINAGIAGVKAVDSSIKIMAQLGLCGDNEGTRTWVDNAILNGVTFDVLGESCYTQAQGDPSTWQANFTNLAGTYPSLSFVISEYAESFADLSGDNVADSGGCISTIGPCNVWRRATDIVFGIAEKKGLGAFVWEPTYFDELLFDDAGKTVDPTYLPNPFDGGARIQLFDQMAKAYGL